MAIVVSPDRIILTGVSYVEPVFEASWIDVAIFAQVSFPDILSVDVVTPVDVLNISTSKLNEDSYELIDLPSQLFSKRLFDSITFADLATIGDIQPHRGAADSNTVGDAIQGFTFEKVLQDSITMLDSADVYKVYVRDFSEVITETDVYAASYTPAGKSDAAQVDDAQSTELGKNVSEGLFLIDNMDGDVEYQFVKVVGEVLVGSDAALVAFDANKDDNLSTISSGILLVQDYCDLTYFLEDYVGTSRTFT